MLKCELNICGHSKLYKEKSVRSQCYRKNYSQRRTIKNQRNSPTQVRTHQLITQYQMVSYCWDHPWISYCEGIFPCCLCGSWRSLWWRIGNFCQDVLQNTWKLVSQHLPYPRNYCNSTSMSGEIGRLKFIPNPPWIYDLLKIVR